ncbi:Fic family protein [Cereibacter sphaeroides]|uniref:Fic family protein n=1 Tax=Cereibacter sphaeroides TaxID=1063 RepID=UPI001F25757C|nr:Fic family protein [Cereibacter sphaeroides]MCE6957973.1 Fic family protein [Cereibacter sphaeroides]MCE6971780.1 Fic family protein [Cereibacter sphaeroides]
MTFETPARIEPCGIEETVPAALTDLALEIRSSADSLGRHLHPDTASELRAVTRVMNAHYSNLIEGHITAPHEIEAALAYRYGDVENRTFAEEAVAHVRVQEWIDRTHALGELPEPTSAAFIADLHSHLYAAMPRDLRLSEHEGSRKEIVPGAFRVPGEEVVVGRHLPPSASRVPAFLDHFAARYRGLTRDAIGRILCIPAAHHRLNYIHPFLDGNGRVSRLMSHAMCCTAGIDGSGLWSISRGLARGLVDSAEYMKRMDAADQPRRGDRDGRGNLSLATLTALTQWFLTVILDQIRCMDAMFDPVPLVGRYTRLVADLHPGREHLPLLVAHVLNHGEMDRGDVIHVAGVPEHSAADDLGDLIRGGFLKATTHGAPIRISFPLEHRAWLFPGF